MRLALDSRPELHQLNLTATSAGTHARPGEPIHPIAAEMLREVCADVTGFASQRLSADKLIEADLVLTATREHRAHCVTTAPVALPRTFTLRQFARLAAKVDRRRLRATSDGQWTGAMLDEVTRARADVPPLAPGEDDIPDPLSGTADHLYRCMTTIQAALHPLLKLLESAPAGPEPNA